MIAEFMDGQWLLAAAVRSVVILVMIGLVAVMLRKASAALVYQVWFLGLLGCLLVLPMGGLWTRWTINVPLDVQLKQRIKR